MNISEMYRLQKPFIVCVDTIEIGDEQTYDIFAVIPKSDPKEGAVKFKGYHSLRVLDLTRSERVWVKENKDSFREAHTCEFGKVYEPLYCNFRNLVKRKQLEL